MDIKTFIFLDMETTGLPYLENCKTRVTELCFTCIQSEHIALGVFPRVQNKLNLCFNPRKLIEFEAAKITGLSNELLEFQPIFNSDTFGIIRDFIGLQRKPVCFVAHNGKRFDYPILKAEIYKSGNQLSEDLLVIDSLEAFRALHLNDDSNINNKDVHQGSESIPEELQDDYDELLCDLADKLDESSTTMSKKVRVKEIQKINETTPQKSIAMTYNIGHSWTISNPSRKSNCRKSVSRKLPFRTVSFKLEQIYRRLTEKNPQNAHKAEYDVGMLIECAAVLGIKFIDWCNINAIPFSDIPMMVPGKKIGS